MDSLSDFLAKVLASDSPFNGVLAIGVAYFGGILSSLTPCVYPMIPITVGVMGGVEGKKAPWSNVLIRGGAYVFGMAVIYSFLGVLAGLTGKVFGSMTNSVGWYIFLGLVITIAGLMMMDVIEFDLNRLLHRFHRKHKVHHSGTPEPVTLVGAFALGATSGFIAAPCTTPVLAAILAFIAKTQSVVLGMALMFAFSAGLGTLLLVIAAFAGALKVLPRSGKWMKLIKVVSGLILVGFGGYLFYKAGATSRSIP